MAAIARVLARFANSFDLKEWDRLEALLADPVELDYTDLRGESGSVARADYVARRRDALQSLDTHHLLGNAEIEEEGDRATARVSGLIQRRRGDRFFHSHVVYDFGFRRVESAWRISAIRQRVLFNEGDPELHAGTR